MSTVAALSVSPRGRHLGLHWRTDPKNYVTAAAMVGFLEDLLKRLRGQVIVVWDGGSSHKGDLIRELCARFGRLDLERLPAYAPDLNPVEWVWAHLKYGRMANFVPRHVRHLEQILQGHLLAVAKAPNLLRQLWKGSTLPFPVNGLCFAEGQ